MRARIAEPVTSVVEPPERLQVAVHDPHPRDAAGEPTALDGDCSDIRCFPARTLPAVLEARRSRLAAGKRALVPDPPVRGSAAAQSIDHRTRQLSDAVRGAGSTARFVRSFVAACSCRTGVHDDSQCLAARSMTPSWWELRRQGRAAAGCHDHGRVGALIRPPRSVSTDGIAGLLGAGWGNLRRGWGRPRVPQQAPAAEARHRRSTGPRTTSPRRSHGGNTAADGRAAVPGVSPSWWSRCCATLMPEGSGRRISTRPVLSAGDAASAQADRFAGRRTVKEVPSPR